MKQLRTLAIGGQADGMWISGTGEWCSTIITKPLTLAHFKADPHPEQAELKKSDYRRMLFTVDRGQRVALWVSPELYDNPSMIMQKLIENYRPVVVFEV